VQGARLSRKWWCHMMSSNLFQNLVPGPSLTMIMCRYASQAQLAIVRMAFSLARWFLESKTVCFVSLCVIVFLVLDMARWVVVALVLLVSFPLWFELASACMSRHESWVLCLGHYDASDGLIKPAILLFKVRPTRHKDHAFRAYIY